MGRPRIGGEPATTVSTRLPPPELARLDSWAAKEGLSRSDAIRRLLAKALGSGKR